MTRGRALNRHHKNRLKSKRRGDIVYHSEFPINKHVTTPKLCSCWMCGNARKFLGNSRQAKTIQELRNSQDD